MTMGSKDVYDKLFGGATHTFICKCGEEFKSKDPRIANEKYRLHKKECKQ